MLYTLTIEEYSALTKSGDRAIQLYQSKFRVALGHQILKLRTHPRLSGEVLLDAKDVAKAITEAEKECESLCESRTRH